jgi:hypothetical protein
MGDIMYIFCEEDCSVKMLVKNLRTGGGQAHDNNKRLYLLEE